MNKDQIYLYNIIESIKIIENYVSRISEKKFRESKLIQDAVSKRLEEIGENAKKVSKKIKIENKKIPWEEYISIRNFLTHVYQMLNVSRLWKIIKKDLPVLKKEINKIIKEIK